jgi:hypothetical protein
MRRPWIARPVLTLPRAPAIASAKIVAGLLHWRLADSDPSRLTTIAVDASLKHEKASALDEVESAIGCADSGLSWAVNVAKGRHRPVEPKASRHLSDREPHWSLSRLPNARRGLGRARTHTTADDGRIGAAVARSRFALRP